MFYTLFSFSKLTPSPQPHSNFVSLNAKKTLKSLTLMSLKVWKKNSRKEKQKKIKKNKKRKNLTPSSSKTIFHTLITLKRYILGTPCNQKCSKKTRLSSTSKKFKKIKISKKRKRFYFVDQSKTWIYIQKIFLTFNNW